MIVSTKVVQYDHKEVEKARIIRQFCGISCANKQKESKNEKALRNCNCDGNTF